ncbi:hypothetical protein Q0Z83_073910 [Actinoplanes sichuanensis]|uniref:Uncharacterized protein n=1 Tax=Actinoplanes sichuanensis TaxID=512349 RepID=A0ABW4A9U1_9ACTN|nr:hypothetical protein [Actinoplanes sichuanensis]BEL09200.1 hypothetical protein Q0Z83_073910 [Actinoplanes sichuanensis]
MRRREPEIVRPAGHQAPPRWIQQLRQGLEEYHRVHGTARKDGGLTITEGFGQWWRAEQDAWCIENGCHRAGTKTCEQVLPSGRDCGARERRRSP